MMTRASGLAAVALVLGLAGCQPMPPGRQNVVVTGSAIMAPLVQQIADRFEKSHAGVRIDVQTATSDRGVGDTQRGLADIGMVARELRPAEMDLHSHPIARDGLCLIVHQSNPLTSLTREQVVRIYTRQITRWKQLDGPDLTILPVSQAEGHALLTLFQERFNLRAGQIQAERTVNSSAECMHLVARQPEAIGYVAVSAWAGPNRDPGVRALDYEGVAATLANVRNGSYPLSRPLFLVTQQEPTGAVKDFLDFAASPAVADLLEKHHFVPLADRPPPAPAKAPATLESTGPTTKKPAKKE
jgi:phosphate transport system substrate-binding protein